MENIREIRVFDMEERKNKLRQELAENGSAVMLHFKGDRFKVFAIAKHTETDEELVAYKCIHCHQDATAEYYNTFWVTPLNEFLAPVNLAKYPDCQYDFQFMFKEDAEREMFELLNGSKEQQQQQS